MPNSDNPITILRFSKDILEESPNRQGILNLLTERINNGYDQNRKKYNIITSLRIEQDKDFLRELGIHKDGSFLMILIAHDLELVQQSLKEGNIPLIDATNETTLDGIEHDQILGTIAGKPMEFQLQKAWEVTAFTSIAKGAGKYLLRQVAQEAITQGDVELLYITMVQEHGLVPYYVANGFKETGTVYFCQVDDDGYVKQIPGMKAAQDFHSVELIKSLK